MPTYEEYEQAATPSGMILVRHSWDKMTDTGRQRLFDLVSGKVKALLTYDELAARLTTTEAERDAAIAETHRWSEAEKRDKLRHQQELAGAGQRAEYATATVRELLREFADGCRMSGQKLADERAEYRRLGRNEEKANLLAWVAMKARELGLPWPLPAENEDTGFVAAPLQEPVGKEGGADA
ncbi:MAG: hypothetical protein ACRYFZ_09635 [Janthinobacterium lividum]